MADASLSVSFWTLFHSLLRDEKGDAVEHARARGACAWLTAELGALRRCCSPEEADLLGDIYGAWTSLRHVEAPSYTVIKHGIATSADPAKEERLKEYEELREDLPRLHAADLPTQLAAKGEEFRLTRLALSLKNTLKILVDGADVKDPVTGQKAKMKGADDALKYFVQRMDAGFGSVPTNPTHGSVDGEDVDRIIQIYEAITDPTLTKGRVIPTGLSTTIDKHIKIRKGQFVGLLGFTASGKTRLGRTWCYHAALNGFHVLHFSLEQTYEEELVRYALIHSHHPMWGLNRQGKSRGLSIKAFEDGDLLKEERDFLFHEVLPDLRDRKTLAGKLSLRQPEGDTTWDGIKTLATVTHRTHPLDMMFIDDMSLVTPKSQRHANEETNGNIQNAKTFAMNFDDSEGLLLVTPVQGSRGGFDDAKKNHGRWDMSGIYMYSQFDKALDLCLSVYSDDDLDAESKILIGSAKYRRGKNIAPTKAAVNHDCGTFHDLNTDPKVLEETLRSALDQL